WETYTIATEEFKEYLDQKQYSDYEGIWESDPYLIGIKKEGNNYIGIIIESDVETWTKGQVKLKLNITENKVNSTYYLRDHSAVESDIITMIGKNHLQIGDFSLSRIYPNIKDEPKYTHYLKAINAQKPYIEQFNKSTIYLRIPSF